MAEKRHRRLGSGPDAPKGLFGIHGPRGAEGLALKIAHWRPLIDEFYQRYGGTDYGRKEFTAYLNEKQLSSAHFRYWEKRLARVAPKHHVAAHKLVAARRERPGKWVRTALQTAHQEEQRLARDENGGFAHLVARGQHRVSLQIDNNPTIERTLDSERVLALLQEVVR